MATENTKLIVWHQNRIVGHIWLGGNDLMGFQYHEAWLREGGFPLSQTMPLGGGPFAPRRGIAHRFFANLLPEGWYRERIVARSRIPDIEFDLLAEIGKDCAGAISILKEGERPVVGESLRVALSEADMAKLAASEGGYPATGAGDDAPAYSLAGAQYKCALIYENGRYWMPLKGTPSTHILKFDSGRFPDNAANEAFTMLLAEKAGLPVAKIAMEKRKGSARYIKIRRYDRERAADGAIVRLHQEDFCQALGYHHRNKYESKDGPSFVDCLSLLRAVSSAPKEDIETLLRWQMFNVLAGNSDGHAKNLSILYRPDGRAALAPFYDLLCVHAISPDKVSHKMAFAVGGERIAERIGEQQWARLATDAGIAPDYVRRLARETAATLLREVGGARKEFEAQHGSFPILDEIQKVATTRCEQAR